MLRRLMVLVFALALLAGACGDDDGSASPPATDGPTAPTLPPATLGDDAPVDGDTIGDDVSECEALAVEAAPTQAAESFPDNPGNTWRVAGTSLDVEMRAVVEIIPTPDDVGYPRFRFVSECAGEEIRLLAGYALDGGSWILLFTTNAAGAGEFDSTLD